MTDVITEHIDIWTSTITTKKSVGRGSSKKQEAYGIKKLRGLILELAIRGKLVSQDSNDEPASVLLEKIAEEKEKLIEEGKIKKQKIPPKMKKIEKPYDIPNTWEWVSLYEIIQISSGDGLTASNMNKEGKIPVFGGNGITGYHDKANTNKPTLVIGRVGFYCGSVHITPNPAWVTDNAFKTTFSEDNIDIDFLYWLLKGTDLKENENATAQPVISGKKIYPIIVALPPVNEQRRIVTKINELMVLCDKLEEEQEENGATHQILVETLLNTLTNVEISEEFTEAWQRIAGHFDVLFTTEKSIDKLQETILQLAVMGKLVAQDLDDEPASVLLEKIEEEKERLVKEGKIKKQIPLPKVKDEFKPFELPIGWNFVRLGDLANRIGSGSTPRGGKSAYVQTGIPFLRSQNIYNDGLKLHDVAYISEETHNKMSNTIVYENDILLNITGGSLGRSTIFPSDIGEANVSQHVTIIRPTESTMKNYLHLCILSPYIQKLIWDRQVGVAREGLSKKVLELFEIPLPPIEEQYRIVKKVDTLISLCDNLRLALKEIQTTQINLADTVSKQLAK